MRLEVGDRIYAINYDSIVAVYTIERTTKTQAISGNVRFVQDDSPSIRDVGRSKWNTTFYYKETEQLKQQLYMQRLRSKAKTLFDVNKLSKEQLEQMVAILTTNKQEADE